MNKFEQEWTSLSKNELVWAERNVLEQKWTILNKNEQVWAKMNMFEQKCTCLSKNEQVSAKMIMCLSKNEQAWAKMNKFEQNEHVWAKMNKFEQDLYNLRREWTLLSKIKLVSAGRNVFEQKWTSFSWLKKHKTILNFLFAFLNFYGLNLKSICNSATIDISRQ